MYLVNCDLAKKPLAALLYRNRNIYIYIYIDTHIVAEPGFNSREVKFL